MWPPDSVKSLVTPWALRRLAISRPPWTRVPCSVSVLMRPSCRMRGAVVSPPNRVRRTDPAVAIAGGKRRSGWRNRREEFSMNHRLDQDPPLEERRTDVRLFAAPTREDEHDAIYPMLAPAAAVTI